MSVHVCMLAHGFQTTEKIQIIYMDYGHVHTIFHSLCDVCRACHACFGFVLSAINVFSYLGSEMS